MSLKKTVKYDILAIVYLLRNNNREFFCIHVYSLLRDISLVLYQLNKDIYKDKLIIHNDIKTIRHKVKLYQKGKNDVLFTNVLDKCIDYFGDDIDNIGIYYRDGIVYGTTLYHVYVLLNTDISDCNIKKLGERVYAYSYILGIYIQILSFSFGEGFYKIVGKKIKNKDRKVVSRINRRDIYNKDLFVHNDNRDLFLFRIIILLNEIYTSIWLYKKYGKNMEELTIESYIVFRFASIKIDEIFDALNNIKEYNNLLFQEFDKYSSGKISKIMHEYGEKYKDEIAFLRNKIHYNPNEQSMMDYLSSKILFNSNYGVNLFDEIINVYLESILLQINSFIDFNRLKSMTYLEKVKIRMFKI